MNEAYEVAKGEEQPYFFVVHFASGAMLKVLYGQQSWMIHKGGVILFHMPFGGLVIRGQHLENLAQDLFADRVTALYENDTRQRVDVAESQPFIEEIRLVSAQQIESLARIGADDPGFAGQIDVQRLETPQ